MVLASSSEKKTSFRGPPLPSAGEPQHCLQSRQLCSHSTLLASVCCSVLFWKNYLHCDISKIKILIEIKKDYYLVVSRLFMMEDNV